MNKLHYLFVVAVCFVSVSANDVNRIINGNPATEHQFPYMVSIQSMAPVQQALPTRGHRCGGVLFTLQHVLTAASCLFDTIDGSQVQINPGEFRIFAGSSILTNDTTTDRIRTIANFTIHPQYISPPASVNNLAVITLASPFAAQVVTPLPLPPADHDPTDFALCTVTGWGGDSEQAQATTNLRFATKYIYNQNLCSILHNAQVNSTNVLPSMVCAASFDVVSVGCNNDNGNPLVCNNTLTGILFLNNNCQPTSMPELYTRVNNYTEWIRSISSGSMSTPAIFMLLTAIVMQIYSYKR